MMRSQRSLRVLDALWSASRGLALLFLTLLCAGALEAEARPQIPELPELTRPKEEEPEKQAAPSKPAGPIYAEPSQAMDAFLTGMRSYVTGKEASDLARAITALDVVGQTDLQAGQTATELFETLNRIRSVELSWFVRAKVKDGRVDVPIGSPPGQSEPVVSVVLTQGTDDGWRIDKETLRQVPAWWEDVRDLKVIDLVKVQLEEAGDNLPPLQWLHWRLDQAMPESLLARWLGVALYQWLALAVLAALCVVLDRVLRFLTGRILARIAKGEQLWIQASEFAGFERPLGIFLAALLFELLLPIVGLPIRVRGLIGVGLGFVISVAGVWAAFRLVDVCAAFVHARARQTASRFDDMLVPLVRRTLKILVGVIGVVYFSSKLSDDITGIVAGLSIGSLAIGFAAKDSIENLFGTFTVLLDKPYQLGDWITVGEIDGTVEEVGFRSTRVRTFYNSIITVPNSRFISAHVDNWGRRRFRRIKTTLSLTYDTPPESIEAFCEGVRQLIRDHPYTRKDYYHVYLNQFSASSLDVMLYCFVETPDWSTELRERHRLFADILRVAERLGVEFAFPTQTVHLAGSEERERPGAPPELDAAQELGRAAGREISSAGLAPFGDSKPPPVVID